MASRMKVLLTGASGLLGRQVLKLFKDSAKHEVTGTAFKRTGKNSELVSVDLTDKTQLQQLINKLKVSQQTSANRLVFESYVVS